ncbi:hypothetical protein BDR26DRAFT_853997, partial [Obelidium mucronatum]
MLETARRGARVVAVFGECLAGEGAAGGLADKLAAVLPRQMLRSCSLTHEQQHQLIVGLDAATAILKLIRKYLLSWEESTQKERDSVWESALAVLECLRDPGSIDSPDSASSSLDIHAYSKFIESLIVCARHNLTVSFTTFPILLLLGIVKTGELFTRTMDTCDNSGISSEGQESDSECRQTQVEEGFNQLCVSISSHIQQISELLLDQVTNTQGRRKILELYERLAERDPMLLPEILMALDPFIVNCRDSGSFRKILFDETKYCEFWIDASRAETSRVDRQGFRHFLGLFLKAVEYFMEQSCVSAFGQTHVSLLQRFDSLVAEIPDDPKVFEGLYSLVSENDQYLISFMLSLTKLEQRLIKSETRMHFDRNMPWTAVLLGDYSSKVLFSKFLESTGYDSMILIDLLMSSETCFLEFLLLFVKCWMENRSVKGATVAYGGNADTKKKKKKKRKQNSLQSDSTETRVLQVFEELVCKVDEMASQFPYNPKPLVKRINALLSQI